MTWNYETTETEIDVYDHTETLVAEDRAFSGAWSDYPDEVLEVMQEEAEAALETGSIRRALRIVALAAFEDIEEGTP